MEKTWNPPLQVIGFFGTRRGDPERGPVVKLNSNDARFRILSQDEIVWVYGPRRHELATIDIDDEIPDGGVVVRDILGVAPTDVVRLVKVDTDRPVLHPSNA